MSQKGKTWTYPFGSVYLRQNKTGKERWYIYYRVEGERIRKVIKNAQSRADALKVLQIEVADAFRGKHGMKKEEKRIKFSELADMYIEYSKLNKKSWREDCYRIEAHLKPFFGKLQLKETTPLLIENYRAKRLKAGIAKSTTNRELALLKSIYSKAIDWNLYVENPVRKVKLFSEGDNLKERILSPEEERRLLDESAVHLKPILSTAIHSGMRRNEILTLTWNQVNLSKKIIRVEKAKSGKIRYVPINDFLLEEFIELKKKNGKSAYVFLNPNTNKPIGDIKTAFNAAKRRAGIKGLRFHDLRHTFATRLIEYGVDLITVKELLGHHSVVITQRYTHSNLNQKMNAVQKLSQKKEKVQYSIPILSKRDNSQGLNVLFTAN